ncbi:MAG: hypothetical protein GX596_06035 [Propionibacterium sp.]|nr:hypothetical protein [Propionibacterium sp.]
MDEFITDTGIADLLLIFSVKSHLIAVRPELEPTIVLDDARPHLSFPTARGVVVVAKSACTSSGTWTVSGPGIGIKSPRPSPAELASTALVAYESARARAGAAA